MEEINLFMGSNKVTVVSLVLSFLYFASSDILKKFNPEIKGMSRGIGKRQTGFNMAVSGAKVS